MLLFCLIFNVGGCVMCVFLGGVYVSDDMSIVHFSSIVILPYKISRYRHLTVFQSITVSVINPLTYKPKTWLALDSSSGP